MPRLRTVIWIRQRMATMIIIATTGPLWLEFQLARRNHTNSYVKIHNANKTQRGRSAFPLRSKKEERKENADFNAEKTEREQKNLRSGASKTTLIHATPPREKALPALSSGPHHNKIHATPELFWTQRPKAKIVCLSK